MYGYEPPTSGRILRRLILLALLIPAALGAAGMLVVSLATSSGSGVSAAAIVLYSRSEQSGCVTPAGTQPGFSQWSASQVTNAATIIRAGQAAHIPVYGQVIAVATAMQESDLDNLDYGDRDSLGLFQQRPSQGWGTPAQVMDPVHAAGQFYAHLELVRGWQQMPLTEAAQAVQASGAPTAYAKWQVPAEDLVQHITGGGTGPVAGTGQPAGACGPATVAAGTPASAANVIKWAQAQSGTMYFYGGTCTGAHDGNPQDRCDCSSLVQQALAHGAGITVPRTAEAQYEYGLAGHAQVIPLNQARPGDVVYFPSYLGKDVIGHTGIVTDPATMTMINAPETGKPVGPGSYNPAGLPYGTHMLTVLRWTTTSRSKA